MAQDLKTQILMYLMEHYGIKESRAMQLIADYHREVATAERFASRAYYPAGQIAKMEKLEHIDPCASCLAEQDSKDETPYQEIK